MTTTQTEQPRAVRGRRVQLIRYRDLKIPGDHAYPGIITDTEDGFGDTILAVIRVDGDRSTLRVPTDYEGLTYLDEVTDVPDLPMGRFVPTAEQLEGEWEGVPICSLNEDGDLIALTNDHDRAVAAMNVYRRAMGGCLYNPEFDTVAPDRLKAQWAVFEWQPEDSDLDWLVTWAAEGDDQAVQLYYLPA